MESEQKLEEAISKDIGIIDPSLMLIGRQVMTAFGKIIDILAINSEGCLTIIELKRNKTPREVVAQTLDYASWVQTQTYNDIVRIFNEKNLGLSFEKAFTERYEVNLPETLNESHNLIIVAAELDNATERIINYLNSYGVPLNVVFFRYFKAGENEYLARSWLLDPNQVEAQSSKANSSKTGKQPWNGRDFYVSLGDGPFRSWEDCRKYGYISAGQGRWYSNTLSQLNPGSRIFACIPKTGYVGVGIVQDTVVPIKDFTVQIEGKPTPLIEADLEVRMDIDINDPDLCEYVVRVEWQKTVSKTQAYWEKGDVRQSKLCL
ncbi:endonuclease NucS domain-containing protein [Cohnella rhizosphaerae]|uniref:Endonuclease NucS n=1 Tax=Cohnella rhizosphaerae TaxID=1457232 RepID=A0A9X4KTI9_9BACL|nr:endonuclease NucS domain-containing protein [Cohnella rhizosphaerae]MDG0810617.1 endonuclease NucS [Cohnella rhizosphaerae]